MHEFGRGYEDVHFVTRAEAAELARQQEADDRSADVDSDGRDPDIDPAASADVDTTNIGVPADRRPDPELEEAEEPEAKENNDEPDAGGSGTQSTEEEANEDDEGDDDEERDGGDDDLGQHSNPQVLFIDPAFPVAGSRFGAAESDESAGRSDQWQGGSDAGDFERDSDRPRSGADDSSRPPTDTPRTAAGAAYDPEDGNSRVAADETPLAAEAADQRPVASPDAHVPAAETPAAAEAPAAAADSPEVAQAAGAAAVAETIEPPASEPSAAEAAADLHASTPPVPEAAADSPEAAAAETAPMPPVTPTDSSEPTPSPETTADEKVWELGVGRMDPGQILQAAGPEGMEASAYVEDRSTGAVLVVDYSNPSGQNVSTTTPERFLADTIASGLSVGGGDIEAVEVALGSERDLATLVAAIGEEGLTFLDEDGVEIAGATLESVGEGLGEGDEASESAKEGGASRSRVRVRVDVTNPAIQERLARPSE